MTEVADLDWHVLQAELDSSIAAVVALTDLRLLAVVDSDEDRVLDAVLGDVGLEVLPPFALSVAVLTWSLSSRAAELRNRRGREVSLLATRDVVGPADFTLVVLRLPYETSSEGAQGGSSVEGIQTHLGFRHGDDLRHPGGQRE